MTDKKKNGWIKFVPSIDLPKERVSIAYDTHDERGVRYAYGYFQFYNGTCGCFWKDGNEQPKVVKAEDIKYWMPVPLFDVQEKTMNDDLEEAAVSYAKSEYNRKNPATLQDRCIGCYAPIMYAFKAGANWQKEQFEKDYTDLCNGIATAKGLAVAMAYDEGMADGKEQLMKNAIDAVVKIDAGGYPYVDTTIELYDYDKDIPLAKVDDKYKVVLIKED